MLRVKVKGEYGFSVFTNQCLPNTHQMTNPITGWDKDVALAELKTYVKQFGTERQREILEIRSAIS